MSAPLLTTKLFVPSPRPNLVSRPRLIQRLQSGLHSGLRLTLVSAPAGFGKTTLLCEWVSHLRDGNAEKNPIGYGIAWLSLDESDDEPTHFLSYLFAALQTIEPDLGKGALSAHRSPRPPPVRAILTPLINEIVAIHDQIVLVLDDYHLIEAQPIHDALTFLLEHMPPQMHLVIATREDPPLPLARLRARGQLNELRAADLRFSYSEAADLLNKAIGLDLSAKDIAALEARTEGWIAGLQLAAISMQGHQDASSLVQSFTGSHRYVLDYLVEEVLDQQSERIQTFLLHTSVLNRLTGPLCDALTGQKNGQATLDMLDRANLFIVPLDQERRWYRYHHLFSELLRRRLYQSQPDRRYELHHQASEWHEQNGFTDEAIEHALRAEDVRRAAHLIEEHADAIWQSGEHTKLWRWLQGLPAELVFSKAHLCVFHAWNLFARGQEDGAEQSLQAAERALGICTDLRTGTGPIEQGPSHDPDRKKLLGRIAAIRASVAFFRGDVSAIVQYSRLALEYLPEEDSAWRSSAAIALGDAYRIQGDIKAAYQARLGALEISRAAGNIYMILIGSMKLAVTMRQQGQLEPVKEICAQQLQLASECGLSQTAVAGGFLAIWGEVQAELGDLAGAIRRSKQGVELAECGEDMVVLGWSYHCLMRGLLTNGDLAGAEELVQKVESSARRSDIPPWITKMMAAWQARLRLAQGKLEAASRWMAERGPDVDTELQFLREFEHIVLARILIVQGRLDEAARLLQRLVESAENGERISSVIEILILQALALQAQGETDLAIRALEKALMYAAPGGFIRVFVDEGPAMARLLYEVLSRGLYPGYVRRLLSAFPVAEPEQTISSPSGRAEPELIEALSERELQVLRLIAEGLTNQEIASRLFLSLNTVKGHTRTIYGKLGVHSRTQAVSRAQALGILMSL